jgi:metallophosphoesterase (TIGR00282 family)
VSSLELPCAPSVEHVRLVMVGDVVGKPGMRITAAAVPWLRHELLADGIIVNAENAADGSGLRCKDYRRLVDCGVDGITLGDHVYRKREIIEVLESESNIIRPANLPREAPGRSYMVLNLRDGLAVAVTCVLGRVFMKPLDCPFRAVDEQLEQIDDQVKVRLVDVHAEATSDMQLMGRYLDGRVSGVLGTHTHVATADERILPGGTGFQCDVGMTGPFESILGRKVDAVLEATLHGVPAPFQVATGDVRLNGTWLDIDRVSGYCVAIGRVELLESMLTDYQRQLDTQRRVL